MISLTFLQISPEVIDAMSSDQKDHRDEKTGRAFVVVVSDANFRRYRMDPLWWSEALKRDARVDGHADAWRNRW
jgi:hypothetical protein